MIISTITYSKFLVSSNSRFGTICILLLVLAAVMSIHVEEIAIFSSAFESLDCEKANFLMDLSKSPPYANVRS